MPKLPDEKRLAMVISNAVFNQFGFGPSQSICLPFARQVLREWSTVEKMRDQ
jgi:hypothetical protein